MGGLLLGVAATTFVLQCLVLFVYRAREPFFAHVHRRYAALTNGDIEPDGADQSTLRDTYQARIEAPYSDSLDLGGNVEEASLEAQQRANGSASQSEQQNEGRMGLQPSSVHDEEQQWRDQ
ncbi:MAG: hypothetical protein LQ342_007747 [Letrouitia transgressa]|nr:MAG: hypothetical protein LQ342_007747 [Letrouitia transgressa]